MHANLIAGDWVEGPSAVENRNPSDLSDVVGEYASADARRRTPRSRPRSRRPRPGRGDAAGAERGAGDRRAEIAARAEELGAQLSREEGKTLPRASARPPRAAQIFRFFAGEALRRAGGARRAACAPASRSTSLREPLGVVGHHHARGTSRSRSRPGRSRRRSPTATRSCASPPSSCPPAPGRSPRSSRAPACRRACSTS